MDILGTKMELKSYEKRCWKVRKNDDDQDGEKVEYRRLRVSATGRSGTRGGGGRRGKPLRQGSWRKLEDRVEWMMEGSWRKLEDRVEWMMG